MAYYKKSQSEVKGETMSLETYKEKRDALKKEHGEKIFSIQATYEKKIRILKGQISALNREKKRLIEEEVKRFKEDKALLVEKYNKLNNLTYEDK